MHPPFAFRGRQKECRSLLVATDYPHVAMVSLGCPAYYGESNARARHGVFQILRPVKAIEDPLAVFNPNRRAEVMHGEQHFSIGVPGVEYLRALSMYWVRIIASSAGSTRTVSTESSTALRMLSLSGPHDGPPALPQSTPARSHRWLSAPPSSATSSSPSAYSPIRSWRPRFMSYSATASAAKIL